MCALPPALSSRLARNSGEVIVRVADLGRSPAGLWSGSVLVGHRWPVLEAALTDSSCCQSGRSLAEPTPLRLRSNAAVTSTAVLRLCAAHFIRSFIPTTSFFKFFIILTPSEEWCWEFWKRRRAEKTTLMRLEPKYTNSLFVVWILFFFPNGPVHTSFDQVVPGVHGGHLVITKDVPQVKGQPK